ncbi:tRNA 2-selenouridine(34) synthase MnmH [Vagococcus elongatus]|uniref:tRNA 2-selenouridine(34) synthase MnmH n=1 Tax=Vagococcus elongatus TaxID=180344 RepID=A0A430AV85_9ENTE|nr:tRNA 2-selenouridine(34) synthase MnmH [Vagococcus elongatus]RSU11955.1 tRNA 2-selenouridine(34) synthase MnmH [Vagococcus elongatus]
MKPTVTYEEVIKTSENKRIGFVDVRSPSEFQKSTIPGAVNIPVLDDDARKKVGELYTNGQIDEAKQFGVSYTSQHLPEMFASYQKLLTNYDELAIFCSRGGMRSGTIFSLLKALGLPVSRIRGGYKAYRQYIVHHLDEQLAKAKFITLYGFSGSGKTEILQDLSAQGAKILDIEGCANHRGSLLGSVGLSEPHSQKMFESLLFEAGRSWQNGEVVFVEGESRRIGKVVMPSSLADAIQQGKKIFINASLDYRVAQICREYVDKAELAELIDALDNLKKVINESRVSQLQAQLRAGETEAVIETLLTAYYDPRYSYRKKNYDYSFTNLNAPDTAKAILKWQMETSGE